MSTMDPLADRADSRAVAEDVPVAEFAPAHARIGPRLVVRDDGWQVTEPAPWRRYLARVFDVATLGFVTWALVGQLLGTFAPRLHEFLFADRLVLALLGSSLFSSLAVVPANALLLGLTGTTPGKWLFGVRVTRASGRAIGVPAALGRELSVWIRGLGLGLPLVAPFTLFFARQRLLDRGATSWDARAAWVVTHRPDRLLQGALTVVGIAACVAMRVALWIG